MKPSRNCGDRRIVQALPLACAAVLCFAAPLAAQLASVEGQVTEVAHSRPVPRVTITLRGPNSGTPPQADIYITETDSNGHFVIQNVIPGRYSISPSHQAFVPFVPGRPGAAQSPPPLFLEPGQRAHVSLQLTPTGVISGRILDQDGDPVREVMVQAMQYNYLSGKRQLTSRSTATTDDRGEYRIFNLPPGSYYLQASSRTNMMMNRGGNEEIRSAQQPQGYIATFFPNARDASSAAPLQLTAGEELPRVDIRMQAEMIYTVRLRMPQAALPHPVQGGITTYYPGYNLQLRGNNPGIFQSFGSMNMGNTWEFRGVHPGSYMLTGTLRNQEHPEIQSFARQIVDVVNHDVEIPAPAFVPGFDVAGTVRVEGSATVAFDKLRLFFRPDETGINNPIAQVSADGAFQLKMVLPESYHLQQFAIPKGAYLKAVKLGDRELPDLQVDFSRGVAPVTIMLASDGGHIEGVVQNGAGDPQPKIRVMLAPDGRQRARDDRLKMAISDDKGHYVINDVAPGEYRLFAWEDNDPAQLDPDFRKPFEPFSVPIKVDASANLTIPLKPIPADNR